MRRFLLAVALVAGVASPGFAGYLVIRVLIEGSGGGGGDGASSGIPFAPPGAMPPAAMMRPPGYSGGSLGGPPGMPPPPGMGTSPETPGSTPKAGATADPTQSIVVVIPVERAINPEPFYGPPKDYHPRTNPTWRILHHRLGGTVYRTPLYLDDVEVQWYGVKEFASRPTPHARVEAGYAKWKKAKSELPLLLGVVSDALEVGLVDEAIGYADELLKATTEQEAMKQPIPARVQQFKTAYGQIQKKLQGALRQSDAAAAWKNRVAAVVKTNLRPQIRTQGHYTLIYWDVDNTEQVHRLRQLETNFRAFYLWHAVNGVALDFPEEPLIAVLARGLPDVTRLFKALDGLPMVSDAFLAPEYNVLVLSPDRFTPAGNTFRVQNAGRFKEGITKGMLLRGDGPKLDPTGKNGKKPEEVAFLATMAMVEQYANETADVAQVSSEGCRQLLFATGLLPQHVLGPQWLSDGAVAFYHRPAGATYVIKDDKKKATMSVALTTGYGSPNYVMCKEFKSLIEKGNLPQDRATLLQNVITDAYFTALRDGIDLDQTTDPAKPEIKDDDPAAVRKQWENRAVKAQATAWALYYYLARQYPDQLRRFAAELNQLPRDLPIDPQTTLVIFARVFDLVPGTQRQGNKESFAEFAQRWVESVNGAPQTWEELNVEVLEKPKAGSGTGVPPGGPPPGSGGGPPPGK